MYNCVIVFGIALNTILTISFVIPCGPGTFLSLNPSSTCLTSFCVNFLSSAVSIGCFVCRLANFCWSVCVCIYMYYVCICMYFCNYVLCIYICMYVCVRMYECMCVCLYVCIYRAFHDLWTLLQEAISQVFVIKKVHINIGPILDGYGFMTA